MPKVKKLTPKERKFVIGKVKGKTNVQAYLEAGYAPTTPDGMQVNASKINTKPRIQEAINKALELHGATPEWAVLQLKRVAEQDGEIGAKRLAAKDILELHGWNKAERPNNVLAINNAFFANTRQKQTNEPQNPLPN